jgi:hypothetical protein
VTNTDMKIVRTLSHIREVLNLFVQQAGELRRRIPGIVACGSYWHLEGWYYQLKERGVDIELRKHDELLTI